MAEGTIGLPPDSTGKSVRTETGGSMPAGVHTPVSALSDATGALLTSTPNGSTKQGLDVHVLSPGPATYSTSVNYNSAASPTVATDWWCMQNPAASGKAVRVTRLFLQASSATAQMLTLALWRRSTLNSGGTFTPQNGGPYDTADPAAVTLGNFYTAASPSLGTGVALIRHERLWAPAPTAQPVEREWFFGNHPAKAVVLHPGQQLSLYNMVATTYVATITGEVEWTEEPL